MRILYIVKSNSCTAKYITLISRVNRFPRSFLTDMGLMLAAHLQARQDVMAADCALNGRQPSPCVFPALGCASKPLNVKSLQTPWTRLLTRAKFRHVRILALRHFCASSQLQASESIQYVKQQLRHSTIKLTVDLYGHLIPGKGRAAVARLEDRTSAPSKSREETPIGTGATTAPQVG